MSVGDRFPVESVDSRQLPLSTRDLARSLFPVAAAWQLLAWNRGHGLFSVC